MKFPEQPVASLLTLKQENMWADGAWFVSGCVDDLLHCASAKHLVFKWPTEIVPVTNLNLNKLLKFKSFLKVIPYAIGKSLCN